MQYESKNMFTVPQVISSVALGHIHLDTHDELGDKLFPSEPNDNERNYWSVPSTPAAHV